jgi:hypothetical protein
MKRAVGAAAVLKGRAHVRASAQVLSRPRKLSHINTVFYEIDMLEFCYRRLGQGMWTDRRDRYVFLEAFLLHYRNLVQFFANAGGLKACDCEVWSPKRLSEEELRSIVDKRPNKKYFGLISQYLSHCTKKRAERDRVWNVVQMYEELTGVICAFEGLFPRLATRVGGTLGDERSAEGAHTASVSVYE